MMSITSCRGQEMLSWRSLSSFWQRMCRTPRLVSLEHWNASKDSSLDFVSANLLQQEYWLETTFSQCSCVNSLLDASLTPHANIIPRNSLLSGLSKFLLQRKWTLYLFLYIAKRMNVSGRSEYRTFKESLMKQCFCAQSSDFSPHGAQEMERSECQVGTCG